MGVKREVYLCLHGFSSMRYGEDIDFSLRILRAGYKIRHFPAAYVFHKRRSCFSDFFRQVRHSGEARVILYRKYPDSLKIVHCLPPLFVIGLFALLIVSVFVPAVWVLPFLYASILGMDAYCKNKKSVKVAFLSVCASFVQLIGYGTGFLLALRHFILKKI